MKYILLAYFLSICMVASSGRQKDPEQYRDSVMDTLKARIVKKADSVAVDAATQIDSIYCKPRIIVGRYDVIPPTPLGPGKPWKKGYIVIWLYKVTGNDTSYHNKRIKPLQ